MKAWIITIGNEVLIGKVINTNAAWLARKLTNLGIEIKRIVVVPDNMDEIVKMFQEAISNADIIISTGGLGPTFDDMTNFALAKALGRELEINKEAFEEIKKKYEKAGLPLTEERVKMSKMPKGAVSLHNPVGTAPGIMVRYDDKLIIALPGVPREMEAIFEESIEKILLNKSKKRLIEKSMVIRGVPESSLAPIISEAMKRYFPLYIKSHPRGEELKSSVIEVHISGMNGDELSKKIEEVIRFITEKVSKIGGKIN